MNAARCFLFGIGVGTAAGLLLAPRTGVKMRKAIANSAKDSQKYLKNMSDTVRDTVTDTLDRTVNAAKAMSDGIETAFEHAKQELVG
jgi:gas vesicle protein